MNFFNPTNPNFLNNVFSTVGSSLNSAYPIFNQSQTNSNRMEEEIPSYGSSRRQQQQQQNQNNPFLDGSFFRNFESFPEIFRPDNYFSSRPRNSRRSHRTDVNYDENPEYPDAYGNMRSDGNGGTQQQPSYTKVNKEDIKKQQEDKKKQEILAAENNPNSGHYYKRIGNEAFQKGKYDIALQAYTKAIEINDTESVFFSNRARCYKTLKNYKKAYEDAVYAIELDETNIKGHLLCGQALAEMAKTDTNIEKLNIALIRMTKALTLCAGQGKQDFEKDIYLNMLRVRKLMWYKKQEQIKAQKFEALDTLKTQLEANTSLSNEEKQKKYTQYLEVIGDPYKPVEQTIPDYLICKITLDLMEDPVTTSSGQTYDREPLMEHLEKNGFTDPLTREPIKKDVLVPNLNIKQCIEEFVKQNPWAFEYNLNEDYKNIPF